MPVSGQMLLHYRLAEKIGQGGMGEVWKATDTTLGRDVAIKILPDAFAQDAERLARFEREARLLASLRHANIAAVHGLHEADGVRFLAMELVGGEDLSKRLARGPLPVDESLEAARQIAEALEAAHEQGVVHRDLKPANIHIDPGGAVKVLDFGLAKAMATDPASGGTEPSLSPTLTAGGTAAGMILGTAAYMSPEQARGRPVDRRADIWAFGCVLYEMLTGRQAFPGETVTDCLAAVLKSEPAMDDLPADTPARIRRLLARCLKKDPRRRLRDVGDARILVEEAIEAPHDAAPGPPTLPAPAAAPAWQRLIPWAVAATMAILAIVVFARGRGATAPEPPITNLAVRLPAGLQLMAEQELPSVAIAPDGRRIAFVAKVENEGMLYVRSLDRPDATLLAGTEGATTPFFSPDGRWIGFFARSKLWKIPIDGGNPQMLAEAGLNRGGVWPEQETIVYAPDTNSALMRVSANGGTPEPLTMLDEAAEERTHRWPGWLPGTREILFTVGTSDKPGDYDDSPIDAVSLRTGVRRRVYQGASMARWIPGGHLMLGRMNTLYVVPIDVATGEVRGEPRAIPQEVRSEPASGIFQCDLAADGTLIYVLRDHRTDEFRMFWVDRAGDADPIPAPPREYRVPRVSPDGGTIAVTIGPGRGRGGDIWLFDVKTEALTRLTFDGNSSMGIWTPDGSRITYGRSTPQGGDAFYWKQADGSRAEEVLFERGVPRVRQPGAWTPDLASLIFLESGGTTDTDLFIASVETREADTLVAGPSLDYGPDLSPDGRFLAYTSNESGRAEVYVRPFPASGGRWQVSDRGRSSLWSRDGRELFYVDGTKMMTVPVQTGSTFTHGRPRELFSGDYVTVWDVATNYDVAPDGRFLMLRSTQDASTLEYVNIVQNWTGAIPGLAAR